MAQPIYLFSQLLAQMALQIIDLSNLQITSCPICFFKFSSSTSFTRNTIVRF